MVSNATDISYIINFLLVASKFEVIATMTLIKLCIHRTCSKWVDLKENDYKVAEYFDKEAEIPGNAESIRQKMFLHFATQENLPHRLAYDSRDFYFVSNTMLEKKYMEPLVDGTSGVKGEPKKTSSKDDSDKAAAKSVQITQATDITSKPKSVVKIGQV